MSNGRLFRLALGVAFNAAFVAAAHSELVEATFLGEVTFVDTATGAAGAPYDQIDLGDPFTLRYVFDSLTPNLNAGGSIGDATARYALLEIETNIGPFHSTVIPSNPSEGLIVVHDGLAEDSYRVGAELPEVLLAFELALGAVLTDSTGSAFATAELPLSLDLSDFDSAVLRLGQAGSFLPPAEPRLFVEARILSFESRAIPEPGSVGMLATLMGAGGWMRFRGSRYSPSRS